MTAAGSKNFGAGASSRFNGAECPRCSRQFRDGEIVCPDDMELLVPAWIDPLVGTVIDKKYRIVSISGSGSQASVYRATHEAIGRTVAVKIITKPQEPASIKAAARLKREARALTLVNHPNLPRIYDFGELKDGSTYMVLEFFEGSSLLDYIKEHGSMDHELLAPLVSQVCDALEHIHNNGLIHRDIKPENILLLSRPQGRVTVKLIDFGVCKFEDDTSDAELSAELCGSPLYMSPENVNGVLVDRRSDIYSLGATVYHAIAGKPPLSETNLIDIVHAHRSVMPAPISYARPDARVPLAFESTIFRALQKLPSNRFQSAADMKVAFQKAMMPEDVYTGRLSQLEVSGAELRALVAFIKAASLEQACKLLEQDSETGKLMRTSLLTKIKNAIEDIESRQSPGGESLEELAMENTQFSSLGEKTTKA